MGHIYKHQFINTFLVRKLVTGADFLSFPATNDMEIKLKLTFQPPLKLFLTSD